MKIDEALVRGLLDAPSDDTVLVLLEGRAQVVEQAALNSEQYHGAAVLISRAELVERLGTQSPAEGDVTRLSASLQNAVDKLGA
ncbi:hypothetical protein ACFT1B_06645 [Streptomyces griseoincarnatus]|uniref:Uncharacterized protein n=3 Tax=Streptomyces TaxID=1883 RepID=A0ABN3WKD4_9ACTN|nr:MULTISPECIES: hypothetical protein [Streptomyces]MDH3033672.1 hypothetical protein [Streptomyces sp. TRM75561]MQL62953.1 hypothetical protein [Streptomyces vinaceus]GGP56024.1 hypothetical protein GCM10010265_37440 [Streptomyces griseoincarnatus]GGT34810.1 hypothetical protein GCM10010287_04140 [Streptomyces variabilis]